MLFFLSGIISNQKISMFHFINYFLTLIILTSLDTVWLTLTAQPLYRTYIGHLMGPTFVMWPALLFYPMYAASLLIFVIGPSIQYAYPLTQTLLLGGLLGLTAYGAYDLTNQATLKDWPLIITIIDMLWGMLVSAIVCVSATAIIRNFL